MAKTYNNEFIDILQSYASLVNDPMKEKAYTKAAQTIITYENPIYSHEDIKDLKGIGKSIYSKLKEYVDTNEIKSLNELKNNPMHLFTKIYGIGPKKAKQLVDSDITTIEALRNNKDKLNNTQIIGLNYYEDINKRIPREEIQQYDAMFKNIMNKLNYLKKNYEIVGSYRRNALTSGDIDVILTNDNDDKQLLKDFINELVEHNIILHKLTDGDIKILVIAKLTPQHPARRIDFLFTTKHEYPFALLYFTGSKLFNLFMRQHANEMGYTLNEHTICKYENKDKIPVNKIFKKEQDIFKFLKLEYKQPHERIDKSSIVKINLVKVKVKSKKKNLNNKSNISIKNISLPPPPPPELPPPPPELPSPSKSPTKKSTIIKVKSKKINKSLSTLHDNIDISLFINNFRENGISMLDNYNISQLVDIIKKADDAFHNDNSIITDNEYDIIKEYIKKKKHLIMLFLKR